MLTCGTRESNAVCITTITSIPIKRRLAAGAFSRNQPRAISAPVEPTRPMMQPDAPTVQGAVLEAARRFLGEPHPLLRNRVPRELAIESDIGARAVEDLLGRLKYGSAV